MWPIDKQQLLQIIILLFFAGAAIVQVLFRVLTRKAQQPRGPGEKKPGERPVEKPFKDVREFLKEIRAEADRAASGRQGEPKKVPVPAEDQVVVWEVVEEPEAPPRAQTVGAPREREARPAPSGDRGRGRRGEGRPAPRGEEPVKGVHEYLEELARRDRAGEEPAPVPVEESLPSGLETALGKRLSARAPAASRQPPRNAGIIGGLSLREAVIAQVILGPPRCGGLRRLHR